MKKIVLLVALLVAFGMCLPTAKAATDEEIEKAIHDGLEWLKAQQNMALDSNSAPGEATVILTLPG